MKYFIQPPRNLGQQGLYSSTQRFKPSDYSNAVNQSEDYGPKQQKEIEKTITNKEKELLRYGIKVPDNEPKEDNRGFIRRIFDGLTAVGNASTTGIYNLTDKNPDTKYFTGLKEGFVNSNPFGTVDESKVKTGSDILGNFDWKVDEDSSMSEKAGHFMASLAIDIISDPLTFATLGLGSVAKGGIKTVTTAEKSVYKTLATNALKKAGQQPTEQAVESLAKRTAKLAGKQWDNTGIGLDIPFAKTRKEIVSGDTVAGISNKLGLNLPYKAATSIGKTLSSTKPVNKFFKTIDTKSDLKQLAKLNPNAATDAQMYLDLKRTNLAKFNYANKELGDTTKNLFKGMDHETQSAISNLIESPLYKTTEKVIGTKNKVTDQFKKIGQYERDELVKERNEIMKRLAQIRNEIPKGGKPTEAQVLEAKELSDALNDIHRIEPPDFAQMSRDEYDTYRLNLIDPLYNKFFKGEKIYSSIRGGKIHGQINEGAFIDDKNAKLLMRNGIEEITLKNGKKAKLQDFVDKKIKPQEVKLISRRSDADPGTFTHELVHALDGKFDITNKLLYLYGLDVRTLRAANRLTDEVFHRIHLKHESLRNYVDDELETTRVIIQEYITNPEYRNRLLRQKDPQIQKLVRILDEDFMQTLEPYRELIKPHNKSIKEGLMSKLDQTPDGFDFNDPNIRSSFEYTERQPNWATQLYDIRSSYGDKYIEDLRNEYYEAMLKERDEALDIDNVHQSSLSSLRGRSEEVGITKTQKDNYVNEMQTKWYNMLRRVRTSITDPETKKLTMPTKEGVEDHIKNTYPLLRSAVGDENPYIKEMDKIVKDYDDFISKYQPAEVKDPDIVRIENNIKQLEEDLKKYKKSDYRYDATKLVLEREKESLQKLNQPKSPVQEIAKTPVQEVAKDTTPVDPYEWGRQQGYITEKQTSATSEKKSLEEMQKKQREENIKVFDTQIKELKNNIKAAKSQVTKINNRLEKMLSDPKTKGEDVAKIEKTYNTWVEQFKDLQEQLRVAEVNKKTYVEFIGTMDQSKKIKATGLDRGIVNATKDERDELIEEYYRLSAANGTSIGDPHSMSLQELRDFKSEGIKELHKNKETGGNDHLLRQTNEWGEDWDLKGKIDEKIDLPIDQVKLAFQNKLFIDQKENIKYLKKKGFQPSFKYSDEQIKQVLQRNIRNDLPEITEKDLLSDPLFAPKDEFIDPRTEDELFKPQTPVQKVVKEIEKPKNTTVDPKEYGLENDPLFQVPQTKPQTPSVPQTPAGDPNLRKKLVNQKADLEQIKKQGVIAKRALDKAIKDGVSPERIKKLQGRYDALKNIYKREYRKLTGTDTKLTKDIIKKDQMIRPKVGEPTPEKPVVWLDDLDKIKKDVKLTETSNISKDATDEATEKFVKDQDVEKLKKRYEEVDSLIRSFDTKDQKEFKDYFKKKYPKVQIEETEKIIEQVIELSDEALAAPEGMRDIAIKMHDYFKKWGIEEQEAGKLDKMFEEGYLYHMLSKEIKDGKIPNPFTKYDRDQRDWLVKNWNDIERRYKGTIKEINKKIKETHDIDNFFETTISRIFFERGLKHNKLMFDHGFQTDVVKTVGVYVEKVTDVPIGHVVVYPQGRYIDNTVTAVSDEAKKTGEKVGKLYKDEYDIEKNFIMIPAKDFTTKTIQEYGPAYAIPETIYKDMIKIGKMQLDEGTSSVLKVWDKFINLIKINQTAVIPGFSWRNAMSNTFQNFLAVGSDALDPQVQLAAAKIMLSLDEIKKMNKSEILFKDKNGLDWTLGDVENAAKQTGITNTGFFEADIEDFMRENVDTHLQSPLKRFVDQAKPWKQEFLPYQIGRKASSTVENHSRMVNFIANLKQGKEINEAADQVNKFLFDYSDLTDFEKNVMKRIIPYYTWMRKNVPLQIEQMFERPEAYRVMERTRQNIETMSEGDGSDDSYLNEYAQDWWKLPVKTKSGSEEFPLYLNPGLPYQDLNKLDARDPEAWARDRVSELAPPLRLAMELMPEKGYNMFFDSPIAQNKGDLEEAPLYMEAPGIREVAKQIPGVEENTEGKLMMDPKLRHALKTITSVEHIDRIGRAEDKQKILNILSYLAGIKATPYREAQAEYWDKKRQYEDLLEIDRKNTELGKIPSKEERQKSGGFGSLSGFKYFNK